MTHPSARRRLPDRAASATFAAWGSLAGRANHLPVRASAPALLMLPGVSGVGPKSRPDVHAPSVPPSVRADVLGDPIAEDTAAVERDLLAGGLQLTAAASGPDLAAAVHQPAGVP